MTKPWFPERTSTASAAPLPAPVASDPRVESARAALLAALLLSICSAMILPPMLGMAVKTASFLPPLMLIPYCVGPWFYARFRRMPRIAAGIELFVLAMLVSLPVLVFSYSAMHVGYPLADGRLAAWDAALGFDALAFIGWLDRQPMLAAVLHISYSSFFPQLLLLPALLCGSGEIERAYRMILGLLLLGIIGASTCIFFPAVGVYVHNNIPPDAYHHVFQKLGYFHIQLDAARLDPAFVLDLATAQGIVAFPSGHAGAAVLCAWAAWGLRRLRWPFLALNIGMFVSAIPQGAHYLVDLMAGTVVALLSIRIASIVAGRKPALLAAAARRRFAPGSLGFVQRAESRQA
ncbi:MAG TPA: phosphatase PAP2 family protein [Allosphingosinicella sp.]|jgi:membrane-associated phospholipid phosphatase